MVEHHPDPAGAMAGDIKKGADIAHSSGGKIPYAMAHRTSPFATDIDRSI